MLDNGWQPTAKANIRRHFVSLVFEFKTDKTVLETNAFLDLPKDFISKIC